VTPETEPENRSSLSIEVEVQRLCDRAAVTELLDEYARLFDDRDFSVALPSLVTNDARIELPPGEHRGIDGMDDFHSQTMSPFGPTQHIFASHLIDLDGDSANFRANAHITHVLPPSGTLEHHTDNLFVVGAILTGEAVRTAAGWRIREATLEAIWRQGDFGPPGD
jgi:SnoaL-like domain